MSSKRKAAPISSNGVEDEILSPSTKRRKTSAADVETAEGTTKTGLEFLDTIKNARDKQNWPIATHFLTLPDKKILPEYYQRIGLPISLGIVEDKLNRNEYPTMSSLEGDLRRMIANAKSFNEKRSQVFSDAEKIRKILSRFMEERNPAYKDPNFQAYTTPVPEGWREKLQSSDVKNEEHTVANHDTEEVSKPSGRRTRLITHVGSAAASNQRRGSSTPAVQDAEGAFESFEGNTFQQAQEKIITEMMNYKDEQDQLIFAPFIQLPSRSLTDYYRIIRNPSSLKNAQKAVRGIKGREPPTGATFLKSWQAFENEVSKIWQNARIYNEDGSPISELAGELEEYFKKRLADAKRVVNEPPQPRVKLRMSARSPEPSKITLKFGGHKATNHTAMSVDAEASKRQQDFVTAAANGRRPGTGPTLSSRGSESSDPGVNGLKAETGQSPALNALQGSGTDEIRKSPSVANMSMPPPTNLSTRAPSGSPFPMSMTNGMPSSNHIPSTPLNSKLRPPGKDASDALILNLNVSTHEGLKIKDGRSLDIPASLNRTQQSITMTVPYTHYFFKISPTLSSSLMHRPSKTFVSCGSNRLHQLPQPGEQDQQHPVFETRVVPGVNIIDVEVIAGPVRGAPKVGSGPDFEYEKFTVFIHLHKL